MMTVTGYVIAMCSLPTMPIKLIVLLCLSCTPDLVEGFMVREKKLAVGVYSVWWCLWMY